VSGIVPQKKLGYSLGLMQVAVFSGMTLGPWIGGLLADAIGFRHIFMVGGAILLLGGALVPFGARERFHLPAKEALGKSDRFFPSWPTGAFPP